MFCIFFFNLNYNGWLHFNVSLKYNVLACSLSLSLSLCLRLEHELFLFLVGLSIDIYTHLKDY